MKRHSPILFSSRALATLLAALAASGCALPRIDPSGDRIFVWPGQDAVIGPVATPGSTPPVLTPGQPVIAPPPGNLTAPPVLSSGAASSGRLCPLCPFGSREVVGPVASQPLPEPPTDRVTLTPGRVLAPVGSEVVLRAGVCGTDGYLLTNRKIEWMLGQQGAGQIATVGEEGELDIGRLPWSRPRKIDNHYAVGYTSPFYTCLRRGTVNPNDDLQVKRGEAWITVTSASEGTSYVTAYAPNVENWNARRARATIYWVDAQWQLPPSAVVAAGQPHVLTTTVTRQSDGAPIAGWIVRYEVADGSGAQLGYGAGQAAEATTDNRGRASVEVTPTDSNPGTTRVRVTIVRPEQAGVAASPRLDVGSGETQITWSNTAPGTQPLFPPVAPPAQPTPPPSLPTGPSEPPPRIDEPPAGRPDWQLRVTRLTQGDVKAGDQIRYNIYFKNVGTGTAKNVVLRDRFDEGLTHPRDTRGASEIEMSIGDLAPGDSREVEVVFDVLTAGDHYHDVTLSADGVSDAFQHVEFTAVEDQPTAPTLTFELTVSPDRRIAVGNIVPLVVLIGNTGSVEARDLRIEIAPDSRYLEVKAVSPELGETAQPTTGGGVIAPIGNLLPGQQSRHQFNLVTKLATEVGRPARIRAFLKSPDGAVNEAREKDVEIIPPEAPAPGAGPLSVTVTTDTNPAQLNGRGSLFITLRNDGAQAFSSVLLQIATPAGVTLKPEFAQISLIAGSPQRAGFQTEGGYLKLNPPIPQLAPGAQVQVVLPYDAVQQGDHTVEVFSIWQGASDWVRGSTAISVRP